jgi:hypothetical protein
MSKEFIIIDEPDPLTPEQRGRLAQCWKEALVGFVMLVEDDVLQRGHQSDRIGHCATQTPMMVLVDP